MNTFNTAIRMVWLIWALYWIANLRGNKPTVRKISPSIRLLALLLFLGLFWLFDPYPRFFHRQIYVRTDSIEIVGIVLCACGAAIAIWARRVLARNWSGSPTIKEGHELIQSGPYRLVRHPIYTGLLVMVLGTCMGDGRVRDLVLFLSTFVMLWIMLKVEESFMCEQFPEVYPQYRNSTKALVPFVL
jgi:protein-S-isoprenylcysteine O-methyltransferase Ste14